MARDYLIAYQAYRAKVSRLLSGNWQKLLTDRVVHFLLLLCGGISILTTVGIVSVLLVEAVQFFREVSIFEFLTGIRWVPQITPRSFGVLALVTGTMLIAVLSMVVALPMGLLSAIYLSEYAPEGARRVVKPVLEVLAGIPTVVYGYFALMFVTPLLRRLWEDIAVFNALSAAIVMGIMILPMASSLSEDAMRAVPRSLREGAYALGATKLEVSTRVVVPGALSGIMAAFILAMSRAVGETMIVTIVAGQSISPTLNPLEPVYTMAAYIANTSFGDTPTGSLEFRTLFAVGMALFMITLVMNLASHYIVRRFREVYE